MSSATATPLLTPQAPGFPLPHPSTRSEPFWDGCLGGRLVLPRCASCGSPAPRAFAVCATCQAGEVSWEESAGRGTLYSWTVVWRPPHPGFAVPYAPAVINLDEGWTFLSAVVGCAPEDLHEGMALQVEFHPASDTVTLPYFAPASN